MRRWIALSLSAAFASCAEAGPAPEGRPGWAPIGGISQVWIDDEVYHFADLLGEPRAMIERALVDGEPSGGRWIGYGEDLDIEYDERGVAVRLKARVPLGIDGCEESARWMGFQLPRRPIVAGGRCTWAGAHVGNRLEKGYGGDYDPASRWFRIWLVDRSKPIA